MWTSWTDLSCPSILSNKGTFNFSKSLLEASLCLSGVYRLAEEISFISQTCRFQMKGAKGTSVVHLSLCTYMWTLSHSCLILDQKNRSCVASSKGLNSQCMKCKGNHGHKALALELLWNSKSFISLALNGFVRENVAHFSRQGPRDEKEAMSMPLKGQAEKLLTDMHC